MFRRNRPMRGRRLFRGGLFNPNGALGAEAREAFDEANALYQAGNYAEAAPQFAHLAEVAQTFNRPRRVVQLHLRAFDAWVLAKNGDQALTEARAALAIASGRRPRQAARMVEALKAELQANGFTAQAAALGGNATPVASAPQAAAAPAAPPPQYKFPTTCTQCGGRLPKSFGEDEIECDYCGTVVRGGVDPGTDGSLPDRSDRLKCRASPGPIPRSSTATRPSCASSSTARRSRR